MSKGGGQTRTGSTGAPAYAQPFVEYGLSEAQRLYGDQPTYYPGQTTLGFSPESEIALGGIRPQALTGSPFIAPVHTVVLQHLAGTNPFQAAAFPPLV